MDANDGKSQRLLDLLAQSRDLRASAVAAMERARIVCGSSAELRHDIAEMRRRQIPQRPPD
jgi:hypothetical protein